MHERSLPQLFTRSARPVSATVWLPAAERTVDPSLLVRRIAQFVLDAIASTFLPGAAMFLFVLLPTHADGSIRSGPLTATITAGVVCAAAAILLWYWVLRPAEHDGRTWGMQLFGIRVVDVSGGRASRRQLGVRWLLLVVDAFALGAVGLTAVLTSERRQRVGDRVARTLVVRGRGPGLD
ncbi:RDD family protein [Embleya sp. NBC_00896]|uniref:RDD family protein n=1 Tax=Embleya sp. NBC_00896 TaxID=2975961 RepID=UPI003863F36D|nr:RDD family protein [Embleya sp. NBC_00896]